VGSATDDVMAEPLLSADEERALAHAIEAGVLAADALHTGFAPGAATEAELCRLVDDGEAARARFIRANLRLVAMVARQGSARSRYSHAELFQEGCVGLMIAVQRYDHRRGFRFATYALPWVRAYVGALAARSLTGAELPTSRAEQLRAVRGVEVGLAQRLGRPATVAELAAAVGRTQSWTSTMVAYEPPVSIAAVDPDELAYEQPELNAVLDAARPGRELLACLPPAQRRLLELRHGFVDGRPHSLASAARQLQMTIGRARRTEQRALDNLRAVCPAGARIHL
jgi:RNA polymerase primary sigma factor